MITRLRSQSLTISGLEFNIQLSNEEVEGSASEAEVDASIEVLSGALDSAPLLRDLRVSLEASSSALPIGAPSFDFSTSASRGPTLGA